ncbi:MAG: apolipoprotein N-acyltransferase, partial [Planctomycetota bacterium]
TSQKTQLRPRWTLLLGIAGGLLYFLSFPAPDLWPLAWVALVPFFIGAALSPGLKWAGLAGLCGGLAAHVPASSWISSVTPAGWLALSLYLSVFWALAGAAIFWFWRRAPGAWFLGAAAVWGAQEFLRAVVPPGFPWLFLGYTQWKLLPLVQLSTLTGVYGLSFLVALVNASLAHLFLYPRTTDSRRLVRRLAPLAACLVAVGGIYAWGMTARRASTYSEGPVVGVVQQNIPRYVEDYTTQSEEQFYREIREEVEKAEELSLTLPGSVQLVVWPETTVQAPLNIDPRLINNAGQRKVVRRAMQAVRKVGGKYGCPVLVGARGWFPRSRGYVRNVNRTAVDVFGNSAILFSPEGRFLERYDKMELVPFGEYVPLESLLSWLTPFSTSLTPGKKAVLFRTRDEHDTRFGALICYEDVFPGLVRGMVRDGADYLVNITEEGWYHIPGEMDQHVAMAVFRAVENRTTVVRAGNTGISCFIGPSGEIYAQVEKRTPGGMTRKWVEGTAAAPVRLSEQKTFYTAWGDVFAWLTLAFSAGLAAFGWWSAGEKSVDGKAQE